VVTEDISIRSGAAIQRQIQELMSRKYGITHATVQLECEGCNPDELYCDMHQTKQNHLHAGTDPADDHTHPEGEA
jgi:cobalt-zinc-cadmium efflux system protein